MHGRPTLEYESLHELFLLLKVKSTPLKHWFDSNGWQITKAVHDVVLLKAMFVISSVNYVIVSANEATIVDAQQWINIHAYMMKNWKQVPILLTLENVEMGATSKNIKVIILNAMGGYGGFIDEAMTSKWVYLGCDGDYVS
jgi:hypothetical protein